MGTVKSMTYAEYVRHKFTRAQKNGLVPQGILDLENKVAQLTKKTNLAGLKLRAAKRKNPDYVAETKKREKEEKALIKKQKQEEDQNRKILFRQREQLKAKKEKERRRIEYDKLKSEKMPNREINLESCVAVRLDNKTVIYVKPSADIEKIKQRFKDRNKI